MNSNRLLTLAVGSAFSAFSALAPAQTGASPGSGDRGTAGPAMTAPAVPGATAPGGAAATSPAIAAAHELKAARLSKLDGVNIYDSNAKKIGEVEDLVIDPESGRIVHALVSLGGVMGIGDKQYAVPTKQLRIFSRAVDDTVPLKVELGAPQDSMTPAKSLEKDSPYLMGSRLVDMDVYDGSGKEVGEIEDVIVDLQSGEAKYVLIEFEGSYAPDDKVYAFPMSALKRDKDGRKLMLNVTKESLSSTPSVDLARLDKVDLSDTAWLQAAAGSAGRSPGGGTTATGSARAGTAATGGTGATAIEGGGKAPPDTGAAPAGTASPR